MNDEDIKRLSEDELARHIDSLESQPWLQEIRSLQPQAAGQDFYALGYAAAQHATSLRPSSRLSSMKAAILSSLLSAAATAFLMWQLSPRVERSSAEREVAVQPFNNVDPVFEPAVAATAKSATVPQNRIETAAAELDDLLRGRIQAASASLLVSGSGGDSENGSGQIESERTRYVTQRQRWLSELSAALPD